jgi:hypothetical protein
MQTSMSLAGFEPTIPVFKRAKKFHALDRAATLTGNPNSHHLENLKTYIDILLHMPLTSQVTFKNMNQLTDE